MIADAAAAFGHVNILEWLESKGFPPNQTLTLRSAWSGKVNVLEWLYSKGIHPNQMIIDTITREVVNVSAFSLVFHTNQNTPELSGWINFLKWAAAKGINPTQNMIEDNVQRIVTHYQDRGSLNELNEKISMVKTSVLKWLGDQGIYPQ